MAGSRTVTKWALILAAAAVPLGCDAGPTGTDAEGVDAIRLAPPGGPSRGIAMIEELSRTAATIEVGTSLRLIALGTYQNHVKDAVWTSSSSAVATVSSEGVVTGKAAGVTTITARNAKGEATTRITVTTPGSGETTTESGEVVESGETADAPEAPAPTPVTSGPWLFQDGFDTGVRAAMQNGAGWKRTGSGSLVSGKGRGGGHALEFSWPATPAGQKANNPPLQEERFQVPRVREAWFEWWVLLPKNWNHRREDPYGTTDNNKFFALWADQYSTTGQAQLILEFNADAEHSGQTSTVKSILRNEQGIVENDKAFRKAPIIVPEQVGVWTRYRVHVRLSSGPGKKDGTARLWRDNTLVWDAGNFEWWQEGGANYFNNGYLFGAQNSGYDQETTVYLDDFRIHHSNPGW